jgi:hypothetical protein
MYFEDAIANLFGFCHSLAVQLASNRNRVFNIR